MDPLKTAIDWVGEKVMGQLIDRMERRVLGEFSPQLRQLQRDVQQIRDAHEDLLVSPLREAMRLRDVGDLVRAREKLIEAESKNPLAPRPCTMLAELFRDQGRDDLAREYVARAVLLNPYSTTQFLGLELTPPEAAGAGQDRAESDPDWVVYLGERDFVRTLGSRFKWPARSWRSWLTLAPRSTAAIRAASRCGNQIAVDWLLADSLHRPAEHVLSLVDARNGSVSWARLTEGEALQFATCRHLVVTEGDAIRLLDAATGAPVERSPRMSRHYFEIMFGTPETTPMFGRANWQGTRPETAYERSAGYHGDHRGAIGDPTTHRGGVYDEHHHLVDAFQANSRPILARNRWDHFHFNSGPNMFPTCHLIGGAELRAI